MDSAAAAAPFLLHVHSHRFVLEPPLHIENGSCLAFTQVLKSTLPPSGGEESSSDADTDDDVDNNNKSNDLGLRNRRRSSNTNSNAEQHRNSGDHSRGAGGTAHDLALRISTETRSAVLTENGRTLPVHLVLGFFTLQRGSYLAVVTRVRKVGKMPSGQLLHQVVHADLLPIPVDRSACDDSGYWRPSLTAAQWKTEARLLAQLRTITGSGALYFSHEYDLTNSAQRNACDDEQLVSMKPSQRADPRFFWNRHLVQPLVQLGLHQYVRPVICGCVRVRTGCVAAGLSFDYMFISRRGIGRQGTRFNVRGVDEDGNVANFVETEQIISPKPQHYCEDKGRRVLLCAMVQTRGSIPVVWAQPPTLKYAPRCVVADEARMKESRRCFGLHFGPATRSSGEHSLEVAQNVVAVNLIDKHGSSRTVRDQRALGELYQQFCSELKDDRLKYVWFDFHHECRKMQWGNLSKLVDKVKDNIDSHGFFAQAVDGSVIRLQSGVVRTNCMDNLDRTNVVQSLFARRGALTQLIYLARGTGGAAGGGGGNLSDGSESGGAGGILPDVHALEASLLSANVLSSPFVSFEHVFNNAWADNADAMSVLYSGTPALKTDFTRFGKRTTKGMIKDGYHSVLRYFINNFRDGERQDAVDLFLGRASLTDVFEYGARRIRSGAERRSEVVSALGTKALALLFVVIAAVTSLHEKDAEVGWLRATVFRTLLAIAIWLLLGAALLRHVFKNGADKSFVDQLVDHPHLVAMH